MKSEFERGEVYWFDFAGHVGSERDKVSPAIILQTDWIKSLNTVIAVPCSKEIRRRKQPTGIFIPQGESGLPYDSVALCHLIASMNKSRAVEGPIGRISEPNLQKILRILIELLDITAESFLAEK